MKNGSNISQAAFGPILTIGATMSNKLDSFNKDKVKCKKCKEYYDTNKLLLCNVCFERWITLQPTRRVVIEMWEYLIARSLRRVPFRLRSFWTNFNDWCNDEQT
jgi:hypothetical protein